MCGMFNIHTGALSNDIIIHHRHSMPYHRTGVFFKAAYFIRLPEIINRVYSEDDYTGKASYYEPQVLYPCIIVYKKNS